ncbi:MAG: type II/IV secretion system protein, partial [Planctomycetes bacterium]|nr:type II/IV secretion system protein [Planctomycetota bacterium]
IKIMARLDIAERRLPQDGRVKMIVRGKPIDLRISTMPIMHGESVVMRVLDRDSVELDLDVLGVRDPSRARLDEILAEPHGIFMVTGPTGSGKTTTLYAALCAINSPEKKVVTVEDPIEYQLDGVNQVQVRPGIGLSFANVLRSMLRQDPDIIMVGEIRDTETARVAIQAALTGHLVFSTLHTNDACSTVMRLIDMGVEGYLLAASLNMVMAQRLCRRICSKCKKVYDPPKALKLAVERMGVEIETHYRGTGCQKCRNTGYYGRVAIHELLVIDDELRELITKNPTTKIVRDYARDSQMIPLRWDGLRKVKEGLTTIEEIFRATGEGWLPRERSNAASGN